MGIIKKQCPICNYNESDTQSAIIIIEDGKKVSYNIYKCNKKPRHSFKVKRAADKKEQELTEKYIKSESIVL